MAPPQNIGSCPPPDDSVSLVPLGETAEEAQTALLAAFPTASIDAICEKDGSYFVRTDKIRLADLSTASEPADPKEALIFEIIHRQATINLFRGHLMDERKKLAEALKTKAQLEKPGHLEQTPLEKVVWGAGHAMFGFGLVTAVFDDISTFATTQIGYLGNLSYLYHRNAAMRDIMVQRGLCGSARTPQGRSPRAESFGKSLPTLAAGVLGTIGAIQLSRWIRSGAKGPVPQTVLSRTAVETALKEKSYTLEELRGMDIDRLREIEEELSARMAKIVKEQEEIQGEQAKVYKEIYVLNMNEAKKRDLSEIQDEELRAFAERIIESGGAAPDKSLLESLGTWDWIGIGIGFGPGTKITHLVYNEFAPWRTALNRAVSDMSARAYSDAVLLVDALVASGDLRKCNAEAEERSAVEGAPAAAAVTGEAGKSAGVDRTERSMIGEKVGALEQYYLDILQKRPGNVTLDPDMVDPELAPLFQETAPRDTADARSIQELLTHVPDIIVDAYAFDSESEAGIREDVDRIIAVHTPLAPGHLLAAMKSIKWALSQHVQALHLGVNPQVDRLVDLIKPDGDVFNFYGIKAHQALAQLRGKNLSFEQAHKEYMSSDAFQQRMELRAGAKAKARAEADARFKTRARMIARETGRDTWEEASGICGGGALLGGSCTYHEDGTATVQVQILIPLPCATSLGALFAAETAAGTTAVEGGAEIIPLFGTQTAANTGTTIVVGEVANAANAAAAAAAGAAIVIEGSD